MSYQNLADIFSTIHEEQSMAPSQGRVRALKTPPPPRKPAHVVEEEHEESAPEHPLRPFIFGFLETLLNVIVNLICDAEQGNLFVVLTDKVMAVKADSFAFSMEKPFLTGSRSYSQLVASSEHNGLLSVVLSGTDSKSSLGWINVSPGSLEESETELKISTAAVPADVRVTKCIFSYSVLICTGERSKTPVLLSTRLVNSPAWNTVELSSEPEHLTELTEGQIFVKFSNGFGAVFAMEKGSDGLRLMYNIGNVTELVVHKNQVLVLNQDPSKYLKNIHLTSLELQSGLAALCNFPEYLTINRHHGEIKEIAMLPGEGGLLVFTEDHAVQLIGKDGTQVWLREEALAHITAVEFVDLPVSAQQATMQEEFGQIDAGILELFVNRLRSQITQLSVAFNSWWSAEVAPKEDVDDLGHFGDYRPLTRDSYNLHKMIVVVSSVGKIFGIESSRGHIVWEYFVPGTTLFDPSVTHFFLQRTTGYFPLLPIACVLLKSEETGLPILIYFDPISGVTLNPHTLKPVTSKQEISGEILVRLDRPITQIVLVPGSISEKTSHIRPLCVIMDDLSVRRLVRMLPEAISTEKDLLPDASGLFVYAVQAEPASLTGYRVVSTAPSTYTAQLAWHMHLSSEDTPQRIIFSASHPSNEHVYSIGRVLGDRNVLYKYVNPNLLAVMTSGVSQLEKIQVVSLYLVDVVVGQVIHSIVHRRASEPASLVVSENWVLYSVYNQRSLRSEFTILELFEPRQTTGALVPSPWQIFIQSLMPSRSGHLSRTKAQFSSQERATHSAFGDGSISGALIPDILQRAYILASPVRSGAVSVSLTERGITAKSLLFGLETGNLLELPKSLLDPRRTLEVTPELQEEGLEPYSPELPLSTFAVISYNKTLERIRRIHTSTSGLESTSLVFAHGLDLFFTRIAPSKTYDLLRDDFDHWFIAMIVVGMSVGSVVAYRLAARRELSKAWQ
ncbi:unnamed protein product [Mesocestoides corti]|uniref:ER membrane protein complex subunit 1 n=1 Tax=Mesocestoides corti TaxID=53468 RepID=A0A3P6HP01_MESCO|nr:unnamed protein product [Mesocestoides corti]